MQIVRNFLILLMGIGMLIYFISCDEDDNATGLDENDDVEISLMSINTADSLSGFFIDSLLDETPK